MGEVKMLQNFCNFGQQGMDESCLSLRRTFAEVINTDRRHDNNKNLLNTMKIAAFHTADLPLQMRVVLHPESEPLSKMMAHAWAAFVRTGDPSTEELPWPAFTTLDKNVMVFDDTTRIEIDPLAPYRAAW